MSRPLALLLLLVCTMLWGLAFVAQKSAMDSIGPLTFSAARFLLGGMAILPLVLWEKRSGAKPITPRQWRLVLALSVVFFLGAWLQQVGLINTTVTNGGFLTGLYVFFVPVIAYAVARTRPHPIIWVGVPLALLGIYYLNGGGLDSFNTGDPLIIVCSVFWAMHILLLGFISKDTGRPILISCASFLIVGVIALIGALLFEAPNLASLGDAWVQIVYSGILSTAVAFSLQAIGQQYVPSSNAAIVLSAESLFAALGGALILGDRLPPIGYAGAALLFSAIVLVETVPILMTRSAATKPIPPDRSPPH